MKWLIVLQFNHWLLEVRGYVPGKAQGMNDGCEALYHETRIWNDDDENI